MLPKVRARYQEERDDNVMKGLTTMSKKKLLRICPGPFFD